MKKSVSIFTLFLLIVFILSLNLILATCGDGVCTTDEAITKCDATGCHKVCPQDCTSTNTGTNSTCGDGVCTTDESRVLCSDPGGCHVSCPADCSVTNSNSNSKSGETTNNNKYNSGSNSNSNSDSNSGTTNLLTNNQKSYCKNLISPGVCKGTIKETCTRYNSLKLQTPSGEDKSLPGNIIFIIDEGSPIKYSDKCIVKNGFFGPKNYLRQYSCTYDIVVLETFSEKTNIQWYKDIPCDSCNNGICSDVPKKCNFLTSLLGCKEEETKPEETTQVSAMCSIDNGKLNCKNTKTGESASSKGSTNCPTKIPCAEGFTETSKIDSNGCLICGRVTQPFCGDGICELDEKGMKPFCELNGCTQVYKCPGDCGPEGTTICLPYGRYAPGTNGRCCFGRKDPPAPYNSYACLCTKDNECPDGPCRDGVCINLQEEQSARNCTTFYWLDDTHLSCEYKNFCGDYTYPGLRVFKTLSECQVRSPQEPNCRDDPVSDLVCNDGSQAKWNCDRYECSDGSRPVYRSLLCKTDADCSNGHICSDRECTNPPKSDCKDLYWLDNNHRDCSSTKQFCGAYTYPDLKVFSRQVDCINVLNQGGSSSNSSSGGTGTCAVDSDCPTLTCNQAPCPTNKCLNGFCSKVYNSCNQNTDCKLIYNSCDCKAVLTSDTRTTFPDPDDYRCIVNSCTHNQISAVCKSGVCSKSS